MFRARGDLFEQETSKLDVCLIEVRVTGTWIYDGGLLPVS